MNKWVCFLLLLNLNLFVQTNVFAKNIYDNITYSLKGNCFYYLDTIGLEYSQILNEKFDTIYSKSWYSMNANIWIKFEIDNESSYNDFLFTIDQWQSAVLYVDLGNGLVNEIKSGTSIPVSYRPESLHRLLTFDLFQETQTTRTYYLRVSNQVPIIKFYAEVYDFLSKLEWQERSRATFKYMTNQILIWFVLGLCFALIVFYLVQLYRTPKLDMIYLLLYVLVTAIFIANIHGTTTLYFFRTFTSFELPLGIILVHLSSILIGLYIRSYLKTKGAEIENILSILLVSLMTISLLIYLVDSSSYQYSLRRWVEGGLVFSILTLAVIKKRRNAGFLLAAFAFALIGRYWSEYLSSRDFYVFGDLPYLAGFVIQLSLFSLGSSLRMLGLEQVVKKAVLEKNKILEGLNAQLNTEVKTRTAELERANFAEIEKNEKLSSTLLELEKTQNRLIESEKMASLGSIAAGLAHELNNPLNVIGGMMIPIQKELYEINKSVETQDLKEVQNRIEDVFLMLNDVQGAAAKATRVVKNLNTITPESKYHSESQVYMQELLNHLIASLKRRYPLVEFNLEMSESELYLDGQMENYFQLFQNIIINGIDAMDELESKRIEVKLSENEKEVIITIRDFGTGIDKKLYQKIFEPFYTTKSPGKGTGLGLFIAKSIMINYKGQMSLDGNANPGSIFTLSFPKSQKIYVDTPN